MNRTTYALTLTSDATVDYVSARQLEPSGEVRISTNVAFGRDQLMPALPELLAPFYALGRGGLR